MKRDPELVRSILVTMESHPTYMAMLDDLEAVTDKPEIMVGHLKLLVDAGYVDVVRTSKGATMGWRLTWSGHEFLDATRDPEIWRKTREGAKKVGSASIPFMLEMATSYAKAKAIEMGIPLG